MYYGARSSEDALESGSDEAKKIKKEKDTEKSAVQSALVMKARVLKRRILADPTALTAGHSLFVAFDKTLTDLASWLPGPSPTSDGRYLTLWGWRLRRVGRVSASSCLFFIFFFLLLLFIHSVLHSSILPSLFFCFLYVFIHSLFPYISIVGSGTQTGQQASRGCRHSRIDCQQQRRRRGRRGTQELERVAVD